MQDARAVAGVGLAAAGAAMVEVAQDLQGLLHDLVGLAALHVDDEADAAGVVLELRIVKALLGGPAGPDGTGGAEGIILGGHVKMSGPCGGRHCDGLWNLGI